MVIDDRTFPTSYKSTRLPNLGFILGRQRARSEPRKGVWCGVSRWSDRGRQVRSCSGCGEAALAALNAKELTWEIVLPAPV
jgi:hypothetical protein